MGNFYVRYGSVLERMVVLLVANTCILLLNIFLMQVGITFIYILLPFFSNLKNLYFSLHEKITGKTNKA